MSLVLDLDAFIPEPREVKLGGKTFNLTGIPFDISVKLYSLIPVMEEMQKSNKIEKESYDKIFDLIFECFKISEPTLEEAWLRSKITSKVFTELMPFILTALFDDGKKNEAVPEESLN